VIEPIDLIASQRVAIRRRKRRAAGWRLALIVYGSAVALAALLMNVAGTGRDAAERAELVRTQAALGQTLGSIEQLGSRIEKLRPSLAVVREAEARPDWSVLLRLVSDVRTESMALRRFSFKPAGPKDDPNASYALEISGVAKSQSEISEFVLELESAELFASVRLRESRRALVGTAEVAEFVVDATLRDGPPESGEGKR